MTRPPIAMEGCSGIITLQKFDSPGRPHVAAPYPIDRRIDGPDAYLRLSMPEL